MIKMQLHSPSVRQKIPSCRSVIVSRPSLSNLVAGLVAKLASSDLLNRMLGVLLLKAFGNGNGNEGPIAVGN